MSSRPLTPLRILPNVIAGKNPGDRAQVDIYRPFFLAGILIVLTTGCLLGAIALFGISQQASYTANFWTPYVLAHANSQLFGWVGFFIIGFALQQHPPRVDRERLFHGLAYASLGSMAVGIVLRFFAEALVPTNREVWAPVGVFSAVLQFLAVALFLGNTFYTRHRKGEGLQWPSLFVFASLFWFILIALAEPFAFALAHQADPQNSILFVAKYFPVLRETQFLGFVAMMIFGVGYVKFPSCFGFPEPDRVPALLGFGLWNAGLLIRVIGWVVYFNGGMENAASPMFFFGGFLLASAAFLLISASRVFEKPKSALPAHKFIRSSMVWLLITALLLALEMLHLRQTGAPFSHAYTGAVRHAVTVGFISQMILGVGMHVISQHGDLPVEAQPALWGAFALLNIGNALRVILEIATDYTPLAFRPMGFSGFIELVGLAMWASFCLPTLLRSMRKPKAVSA